MRSWNLIRCKFSSARLTARQKTPHGLAQTHNINSTCRESRPSPSISTSTTPMHRPDPKEADVLDATNCGPEFDSEPAQDSYVDDPVLSRMIQNRFAGFSYSHPAEELDDTGESIKDPSFVSTPWTMPWKPDG
ncbi:hypothetical protein TOPH_02001 [Tolypocladium ophioglossoides CBS 100239]|uniref:Protein kinase C-terminal domain-containing protein n=1 Tax=Tolypocladium ophioglossoides (strain CBS 100239) TaxID=1163406 RepID=A0A0L0NGK7_TOLOC|nr:hypothetical protein TOPH_02001 [Tolypocladium ophioglossoides CBS 100239]